jgi:tRNA pseudouridine38-40 synthase
MNEKKTRIKFTLSYDGTDFCGWQRQSLERETNQTEKPSLSRTVENALEKIFKHPITLGASGRTDAGVHAVNQVAHFDTTMTAEQLKRLNLSRAAGSFLPPTIVIKKTWIAPDEFHSTLSAEKKTYRYLIYNSKTPSAFFQRTMGYVQQPLDIDFLNQCSKYLIGHHDFKSFQSVGTDVATTDRTIHTAKWRWLRPNIAEFSITGSGFLKQMVRNIVGTELLLARKNQKSEKMADIIAFCDRKQAGPPAEPQGLYLMKVYYPQDLDNKCLGL